MNFEDLIVAINNQDEDYIMMIIKFNPFIINEFKIFDQTKIYPIQVAINNGLKMTKILVENGACIFVKNGVYTLLSQICKIGDEKLMEYFLPIYFGQNLPESFYHKSFSVACYYNRMNIVQLFHSFFPKEEVLLGMQVSICKENYDIINFLAPFLDEYSEKIITWALEKPIILGILFSYYFSNKIYPQGNILQKVVNNYSHDIFMNLVKHCSIEALDNYGNSAIFYISENTDIETIKYLLSNSNLSHKNCYKNNVFEHLIENGVFFKIKNKLCKNEINMYSIFKVNEKSYEAKFDYSIIN